MLRTCVNYNDVREYGAELDPTKYFEAVSYDILHNVFNFQIQEVLANLLSAVPSVTLQ